VTDKGRVGPPRDVQAERRKAGFGCFLAFLLPPMVGVVVWQAADLGWALTGAAATFLGATIWSGWIFARTVGRDDFEPQWSFNPMSSILIAATDVFSTTGDLAALTTGGLGYLIVVAVGGRDGFTAGRAETLFRDTIPSWLHGGYDVSPDGERFVTMDIEEDGAKRIVVLLDWFQELERLVPAGR